jgi:hypothetical protein
MKRKSRLQAAVHWIPKYSGKNLVRGYAKHFGVNLLCAIIELETLGYKIEQSYKDSIRENEEAKQRQAILKKQKREVCEDTEWYDEYFYSEVQEMEEEVPF